MVSVIKNEIMKIISIGYKFFLMLIGLFLLAPFAEGQHHKVEPSEGKNIFLSIMDTMMKRMDSAQLSGVVETDFLIQMIPHHKAAIAMADYEISHGKDFDMLQLAKSIAAEQTNEVQLMNLLLQHINKVKTKVSPGYQNQVMQAMNSMMNAMPENELLNNNTVDEAFALVMLPHHRAAIDMAKAVINFSEDVQINAFAKNIISSENIEIEQMTSFTNDAK